jgi:hypothetical protein
VAWLVCHPQTPTEAVQAIEVAASRLPGGFLELTYSIRGRLSGVAIPAPRPAAVRERLWQHTCCEAFLAATPGAAYREFNFSPSGEWAAYDFERYRQGAPVTVPDPQIAVRSTDEELQLRARIALSPGKAFAALSAVIEEIGGRFSYWALAHPPGKPDFHHPVGFTLELA